MNDYKETQFGWLLFLLLIPAYAIITYVYVNEMGNRPFGSIGFIILSLFSLVIYLLFYRLTTRIDSNSITISFGVGIISKRIPLKSIKTVATVTSPWYYGWGIRFIPNGMLYNISGFDGVELTFKDASRIFRIGSADSSRLKQELLNRINLAQ